jgi:hypothetical protein
MPFVQIGFTATRAPDGSFLESVPIYAKVSKVTDEGLASAEDKAIDDIAQIFAEKFKQYKSAEAKARNAIRENGT